MQNALPMRDSILLLVRSVTADPTDAYVYAGFALSVFLVFMCLSFFVAMTFRPKSRARAITRTAPPKLIGMLRRQEAVSLDS